MKPVPNVCGHTLADAEVELGKAGFKCREKGIDEANAASRDGGVKFGDEAEKHRPTMSGAAEGTVISQDPPANQERPDDGSVVVHVVVAGPDKRPKSAPKAIAPVKPPKPTKEEKEKADKTIKAQKDAEAKAAKEAKKDSK